MKTKFFFWLMWTKNNLFPLFLLWHKAKAVIMNMCQQ